MRLLTGSPLKAQSGVNRSVKTSDFQHSPYVQMQDREARWVGHHCHIEQSYGPSAIMDAGNFALEQNLRTVMMPMTQSFSTIDSAIRNRFHCRTSASCIEPNRLSLKGRINIWPEMQTYVSWFELRLLGTGPITMGPSSSSIALTRVSQLLCFAPISSTIHGFRHSHTRELCLARL